MLKLSSVIGAPFRPFVRRQLVARVAHSKTGGGLLPGGSRGDDLLRTSEDVQYLANQVGWVKLSSSVKASKDYLDYLQNQFADSGDYSAFLSDQWTSAGLARNWVLQGGTSKDAATANFALSILQGAPDFNSRVTETVLREGIGPDGAYGLGGTVGQGYRPMPGITSVKVQTAGRGGSLRYATIDFKVWNRNQLDIIDTLYLRLGYTMLLEWGHAQYYETAESTELIRDNYGIDKFFIDGVSKDTIQYDITRKVIDSNGNYDGMLGVVCNFDCSFNQEGGWDCSIKLIGLGSIMESQKINLAYTMPPDIQKAWKEIIRKQEEQLRKERQEAAARENRLARIAYGSAIAKQQQDWDSQHPIRDLKTLAESIGTHKQQPISTTADLKKILEGAKVSTLIGTALTNEFYYFANPSPTSGNPNKLEEVLYKGQTPPTVEPTTATLPTTLPIKVGTEFTYNFAPYNAAAAYIGVSAPAASKYRLPNISSGQLLSNRLAVYKNVKEYTAAGATPAINKALQASATTQAVIVGLLETKRTLNARTALVGYDNTKFNYYDELNAVIPGVGPVPGLLADIDGVGAGIDVDELRQYRPNTFTVIKTQNGVAYRQKLSIIGTSEIDRNDFTGLVYNGFRTDDNYFSVIKAEDLVDLIDIVTDPANPMTFQISEEGISYVNETVGGVAYRKAIVRATAFSRLADVTLYSDPSWIDRFKNVSDFTTLINAISKIAVAQRPKSYTGKLGLYFQLETEILTPITVTGQETARPTLASGGGPALVQPNYDGIAVEIANMSLGLSSALEAMLTVIKYDAITSYKSGLVHTKSLVDLTGKFLNYGAGSLPPMAPLFKKDAGGTYELNIDTSGGEPDKVVYYPFLKPLTDRELLIDPTSLGVKGYATSLLQGYNKQPSNALTPGLTDRERWEITPSVDFETLFKSYLIAKSILSSAQDKPNYKNEYPVYITLGYLLFFINNQSLLYDTTRSSKVSSGTNISRPVFYIDYNNITNLCSALPSQLSVNPEITMIPFGGTPNDYKSLFPQNVTPSDQYFLEGSKPDNLSKLLPAFKPRVTNHGRTMNILLNIDYLLGLIKSTVDRDNHNNVYLQAFLENIVTDLNKSLGDVNAFRVGYSDASNTVQITDDQAVPPLPQEDPHLFALKSKLLVTDKQLFEFPVFELGSLARNFTLQSNTSTKMSRAIAIGAQAANNGSVQSVDASAYHWLNNGLTDRMIVTKQNATQPSAPTSPVPTSTNTGNKKKSRGNKQSNKNNATAKTTSTAAQEDPNKILATKFNTHIINIYSTVPTKANPKYIYRENVDSSRNFLIQGATKAKADDQNTYGSLSIPYNATITITGISGIIMGNAFLLPDKVLPLSIRGTKEQTKFGFYVMGLDHTLDSNQWVTDIKGQIVRIREIREPAGGAAAGGVVTGTPVATRNTGGMETTFVASNIGDGLTARQAVEAYFGNQILDVEWSELVATTFAESGNTQEQRGNVLGAVLNAARLQRESITDSIRRADVYYSVTGNDGKTASQSFKSGPDASNEQLIYQAAISIMPTVPKNVQKFTAYNQKLKRKNYKKYLAMAKNNQGYVLYDNNDPKNINGTIFITQ